MRLQLLASMIGHTLTINDAVAGTFTMTKDLDRKTVQSNRRCCIGRCHQDCAIGCRSEHRQRDLSVERVTAASDHLR
jgi:hypothetical protein